MTFLSEVTCYLVGNFFCLYDPENPQNNFKIFATVILIEFFA